MFVFLRRFFFFFRVSCFVFRVILFYFFIIIITIIIIIIIVRLLLFLDTRFSSQIIRMRAPARELFATCKFFVSDYIIDLINQVDLFA